MLDAAMGADCVDHCGCGFFFLCFLVFGRGMSRNKSFFAFVGMYGVHMYVLLHTRSSPSWASVTRSAAPLDIRDLYEISAEVEL